MHIPAKGKPKRTDTMDIQRVGFSAEAISRWVGEQTDIQVCIRHIFYLPWIFFSMFFNFLF